MPTNGTSFDFIRAKLSNTPNVVNGNGSNSEPHLHNGYESITVSSDSLARNIKEEDAAINGDGVSCNNNLTNSLSPPHSTLYTNMLSHDDNLAIQLSNKVKNNNNEGVAEKPTLVKDGMEEYFKEYGSQNSAEEVRLPDEMPHLLQASNEHGSDKPHMPTTTVTTATLKGNFYSIFLLRCF